MIEQIALTFFVISITGMSYLLFRVPEENISLANPFSSKRDVLSKKISSWKEDVLGSLRWENILQKALSKIRIFVLRMDSYLANSLVNIRKKVKDQKERDEYWRRISLLIKKKK